MIAEKANPKNSRQLAFTMAAIAVIAIGLLFFMQGDAIDARRAVARIVLEDARSSLLGGPVLQGALTKFELQGMSERGDCKKVHAFFRVGNSSDLEGTFLYLDNGDDVAFRTLRSAIYERRASAFPGRNKGELNEVENRICGEMLSRSAQYSDGAYLILK